MPVVIACPRNLDLMPLFIALVVLIIGWGAALLGVMAYFVGRGNGKLGRKLAVLTKIGGCLSLLLILFLSAYFLIKGEGETAAVVFVYSGVSWGPAIFLGWLAQRRAGINSAPKQQ